MRLVSLRIRNFKSIIDSHEIRIESLQALVGPNNSGKSNILYAIDAFLSPQAGGVKIGNFNDGTKPILITATFSDLLPEERRALRKYLLGDRLILEKQLRIEADEKSGKDKVTAEYHGYMAEPSDWWLSVEGVEREAGARPKWNEIASEHGLTDYVTDDNGRVNKASYRKGLETYLAQHEVEYVEPRLGETQALGLQAPLLANLPRFHLLPAITDYSDEIDRRTSSTVFRRLMGELGDRILRTDPRYVEIEAALAKVRSLLNSRPGDGTGTRLEVLSSVEAALTLSISDLMPSVKGVQMQIELEESKDIFSRGVTLRVDDGVVTDVLDKGHGLQRSVVFGLLKTLIKNERGQLLADDGGDEGKEEREPVRPIMLAIEEPELYIHPQLQRLIFKVLKEFVDAGDQVIYSTHSPAFVDIGDYHRIALVRKVGPSGTTVVFQCDEGVLSTGSERKDFKFATSFGLAQNRMVFADRTILVEGPEDEFAILQAGRVLGYFKEFAEEVGHSIVVADGKGQVDKLQRLLNGFKLPYAVLVELDGRPTTHPDNAAILEALDGNTAYVVPNRLEDIVGHKGHFKDPYAAKKWLEEEGHITDELKAAVKALFRR